MSDYSILDTLADRIDAANTDTADAELVVRYLGHGQWAVHVNLPGGGTHSGRGAFDEAVAEAVAEWDNAK